MDTTDDDMDRDDQRRAAVPLRTVAVAVALALALVGLFAIIDMLNASATPL